MRVLVLPSFLLPAVLALLLMLPGLLRAQGAMLDLPAGPRGAARPAVVRFIGMATVLIRYQGLTILTDPNFLHKGDHVQLDYGLKARRLSDPALSLAQLPPLDLSVLSHLHEDHFDKLVQARLDRHIPIVSTAVAAPQLERMGFYRPYALAPWDALTVRKAGAVLTITATPARHGPPALAALLPPVMGSVLDFAAGRGAPRYRIYISGDTVICADLAGIAQRFPRIDLALLRLGGARLLGPLKVSMDGADGVRLLRILGPRKAIPIHYDDYELYSSPLADFASAVDDAGLGRQVIYLKHGDFIKLIQLRNKPAYIPAIFPGDIDLLIIFIQAINPQRKI